MIFLHAPKKHHFSLNFTKPVKHQQGYGAYKIIYSRNLSRTASVDSEYGVN